jgi:hypothetical protein
MLYCELDDAFNNKTYKFRESFSNDAADTGRQTGTPKKGIFDDDDFNISTIDMNNFNVSNNKIMYDSEKKGQDSDWAPIDSDTELLPKKKPSHTSSHKPSHTPSQKPSRVSSQKSWNKDDTISIDSESVETREETKSSKSNEFGGTSLAKLSKSRKPTHRECIKLYYNPTTKSSFCFDTALKHITKCELCKKEISKKKSVKFDNDSEIINKKIEDKISCSSSLNSFINNLREIKNNKNSRGYDNETLIELVKSTKKPIKNKEHFETEIDDNKILSMQSQMELQAPPAKPIAQSIVKPQEDNTQYQNMMIQNTIQKYFEDMEEKKELNDKLNKIYEILNLEIKKNEIIEKERNLSQYKNNSTNSTEYSGTWILIGISVVIILLIVDIVLRIKF